MEEEEEGVEGEGRRGEEGVMKEGEREEEKEGVEGEGRCGEE